MTKLAYLMLKRWGMHKTHFYFMALMVPLAAVVARIIAKLKMEVPVGYQDESGFHVGTGRSESKVSWPPFW
jgi:hypothetical protein